MFTRIYKSIFYRIRQTSLLMVVMFVVSLLVCSSFSLKNISLKLKNDLSSSIEPIVAVTGLASKTINVMKLYKIDESDYQKYSEQFYEDLLSIKENIKPSYFDINMYISSNMICGYGREDGLLLNIEDKDLLKKIKSGDFVEEDFFEIASFNSFVSNEIDYCSSFSKMISVNNSDYTDLHYHYKTGATESSINNEIFGGDDTYEEFSIRIKEGRNFNNKEIENGELVCLISPNLYLYNDGDFKEIKVGDYISYSIMKPIDGDANIYKTYQFKVIGITNQEKLITNRYTHNSPSSVFVPENALLNIYDDCKNIAKQENLDELNYLCFYPCIMTLNSFDDIDKFVDYIEELNNLSDKDYKYETALDSYYNFAGNLETISDNSDILFKFSLVVSILLNIFIINLDLNRRKKEIGLLSSLGQSKKSLMIELILEYVGLLLISLIFAVLISNIVSTSFIKTLEFNNQTLDTSSKVLDYSTSIKILNNSSVNINFFDFIKIALIEILIIIVTTILSVIQILSIKVREVMIDE